MIKQMKYEIFVKDKKILKYIFELMNETQYIVNRSITLLWDYNNFKWDFKAKKEIYPNPKDVFEGYTLKGALNNQINKEVYRLQSDAKDMAVAQGTQLWSNSYKEVFSGKKSIPNFKGNRIFLKNRSIKVIKDGAKHYLDVGLFSKRFSKENEFASGRVAFDMIICDNTQRTIVNKILDGEYKIAGSSISWSKGKLFVNLGYEFEAVKASNKHSHILGVDLGVKYVAYMSVSDSEKSWYIDGGEIEAFRTKTEKLQRQLRMQSKHCLDGNAGHGKNKRCQNAMIIQQKAANFKNLKNHKYAKFIVDYANKNNCGIIQMENLSGIGELSKFLKKWAYYDLQQKIRYKAECLGIELKLVDPKYTSQRCSKCGYVDKKNRKVQEKFECLLCGYKDNADRNASKNLSVENIDLIIEESIK